MSTLQKITARWATEEEIAHWDEHVVANPNGGNMLQAAAIAETKEAYGWTPRYLVYEGTSAYTPSQIEAMRAADRAEARAEGETKRKPGKKKAKHAAAEPEPRAEQPVEFRSYNLVLEKKFPLLGTFWYLSKGPDVYGVEDVPLVMEANRAFDEQEKLNLFAIKFEADIVATESRRAFLARTGLRKQYDIQPNDSTPIVYTDRSEDELFASFDTKCRNKIRRAIKDELDIRRVELTDENLKAMYALMSTVGQGEAHPALRPFDYYRRFWTGFGSRDQGRLYFYYEDGEPAVGAFVVDYGAKATYKDGGSKPRRRGKGDAQLIQWTSMTDLMKEKDVQEYDLCSCPPKDRMKDPEHPFYGIGQFKTSFTRGKSVDYVGVYDQVLKPAAYAVWEKVGEKLARRVEWRRTGQPLY